MLITMLKGALLRPLLGSCLSKSSTMQALSIRIHIVNNMKNILAAGVWGHGNECPQATFRMSPHQTCRHFYCFLQMVSIRLDAVTPLIKNRKIKMPALERWRERFPK